MTQKVCSRSIKYKILISKIVGKDMMEINQTYKISGVGSSQIEEKLQY
jgi:hypothetical protein